MSPNSKLAAVLLSALIAFSVVGPGFAMADSESAAGNLAVDVVENDEITVTVTEDGDGVANVTANVTVDDENITYDGAGTHTTDDNGAFTLPTPEETVKVTIHATVDNRTVTRSTTLTAEQEADEPEESDEPFGIQVTTFIESILNDRSDDRSIGERVAGFVTSNNPGNPPAHAGPGSENESTNVNESTAHSDANSSTNEGAATRTGPPEHASPDGDAGPPKHVGANTDKPSADGEADDSSNHGKSGGSNGATENSDSSSGSGGDSGNSGSTPGNSGSTPGNSGSTPGNSGSAPGN